MNDSLQSIHAKFIDVHTELGDLIESNEAFIAVGTVNSLSLEQYYSAVNKIYQEVSRSEEHTSELQSPVPISYAVFCLKKKKT